MLDIISLEQYQTNHQLTANQLNSMLSQLYLECNFFEAKNDSPPFEVYSALQGESFFVSVSVEIMLSSPLGALVIESRSKVNSVLSNKVST